MGNHLQKGLLTDLNANIDIINKELIFENKENKYRFYNKDTKEHPNANQITTHIKTAEESIKNIVNILQPSTTPTPTPTSTPIPTSKPTVMPTAMPTSKPTAMPTAMPTTLPPTREYFTNTSNDNCDWLNNYLNVALLLLILCFICHKMGYRIVKY